MIMHIIIKNCQSQKRSIKGPTRYGCCTLHLNILRIECCSIHPHTCTLQECTQGWRPCGVERETTYDGFRRLGDKYRNGDNVRYEIRCNTGQCYTKRNVWRQTANDADNGPNDCDGPTYEAKVFLVSVVPVKTSPKPWFRRSFERNYN